MGKRVMGEFDVDDHINRVLPLLDEHQRRLFLASEAMAYGHGGISMAHTISGVSIATIRKGIDELESGVRLDGRIRQSGGGRRPIQDTYPDIEEKILKIVDPETYGDPERVLSYTTVSLRDISDELAKQNVSVSHVTVVDVLDSMGYSKQVNQKMLQLGVPHPDRNAQFERINATVAEHIKAGVPVISIDAKKKENVGNFKNAGAEYRPKKDPREVLDHDDFPIAELGKVV